MNRTIRTGSRWMVLAAVAALLLVSQAATAADRVNTMVTYRFGSIQPWQVRPGVSLPVFGNATDTGSMPGDGSANGDTYTFSFSANPDVMVTDDGSLTGTVVNDKYIVENVTFTLLNGSTREIIEVTLTVDDGGGSVDSDTREIDIVDATDVISDTPLENLAIEVNIAIQDGLRAAYLAQQGNGRWTHGTHAGFDCATTGFTVWAFANSGHLPTNDVDTDIYAEFVQKGIDFILSKASAPGFGPQPFIGDPDADGNGRIINLCPGGLSPEVREGYSTPISAAGIIAAYSVAPGTLVAPGSFAGQVAGDTYASLIQDAIDWIAFAQEGGGGRGGWRYTANYGSADTSVDSWAYVAMEGLETVFGGTVLELVKQEAEFRINASQSQGGPGDLGQFGYGGTGPLASDGNATTAGGLSGLVMVTAGGRVPPLLDGGALSSPTFPNTASRKIAAVSHLGLRWDVTPGVWRGNRGNFYAMWTTARALRLNTTTLLVDKNAVVFDWETGEDQANLGVLPPDNDVHEGYFPFLVRTQAGNGHWGATVNTTWWTQNLNTAWGILILQPTVFGPPPPDNEPPVCAAPAAVVAECQGLTSVVLGLDGSLSSDPDSDPLTFSWTTDCPGGSFDDASSATPTLTVDSIAPCPLNCTATLTVSDPDGEFDTCDPTAVTVEDTVPPSLMVDTSPIEVVDVDCSGDEAVDLPTAGANDVCDPAPVVGSDAPATFPAGETTTVTYTASDACSNSSSAGVEVTVLYGADIAVRATKNTGGSKEPLVGIEVCGYDKAEGSCVREVCHDPSHRNYRCIVDNCAPVNCCVTNAHGRCTINLPPGDYVVISDDATKTTLSDPLGVSASDLVCGELKRKHLVQVVNKGKNK